MHIRVHTNDRPYPCPYKDKCNQSFKTRSQLNDHILKHTKIKKHVCPECKASFSRKSRLKIHLMIHKGEKPFQCEICKKQFREKSNYNYHLKKHDNLSAIKNKEKNKNDFCKYKFKRIHKSSDNFNTTKSNSNNSIEKISEDEIFDNNIGQKNQSFCINLQSNIQNVQDLNNIKNQNTTRSFDLSNKEDIKIFDNINCNIKTNDNIDPFLLEYSHCFKGKNLLNEESEIKERYFDNINDLSISNEEYINFSSDNNINFKIKSKEISNNLYLNDIKFNFETSFLKNILN